MSAVRPNRQRGFSLIELLVAFAILAVSLGLLYKSMGSMVRSVGDLENRQRASLVAQGLLRSRESVGASGWNESGVESGFAWQVQSRPYTDATKFPGAPRLHEVTLVVGWGEAAHSGQIQLQTLLPERKPTAKEAAS